MTDETVVDDEAEEEKPAGETKEQKRERTKQIVLNRVAMTKVDTVRDRVAWIMNREAGTRDSDVALMLKYWEIFEPDLYARGNITPGNLFHLTRLTVISRQRATIQNEYKLFLASEEVQKRRGTLDDENRERHAAEAPRMSSIVVYADESGKNDDNLLIGTFWILDDIQTLRLKQDIEAWRQEKGFTHELHFSRVSNGNLHRYMEILGLLVARGNSISFKVLTVPRRGNADADAAIDDLLFNVISRGIRHEDQTGRAPLPRSLQVWKDAGEEGRDMVAVANLKERLEAASAATFNNRLRVDSVVAVDSSKNDFIQISDLFLGSVNRYLHNNKAEGDHAKDQLARAFLDAFCGAGGIHEIENDMVTFGSL
jgi:hypothetical protein